MTKFEEEFKALTSWDWVNVDLIQQILAKFGNWHSDEEFQEMKESYWNQAESILSMLEEIKSLKSQLQQQALPVVPECVAGAIESIPDHYSAFEAIDLIKSKVEILTEENKDWLPVYNWLCEGVENQDVFALAFITGKYQVEKPQMFEVKMPIVYWDDDASQLTNGFEFLRIDKETDEVDFIGFLSNTKKHTVYFTEQEIKSIDERYWQFAVPVEDNK